MIQYCGHCHAEKQLAVQVLRRSRTSGRDSAAKLHEFEKSQLSKDTAVECLRYTKGHLCTQLARRVIYPHVADKFDSSGGATL
jgi:hypothetical protein